MEGYLRYLRIESLWHVLLWTVLVSALTVTAPVLTLAVPLAFLPKLPREAYWGILAIAAAIPLIITPPIALFALGMLRLLTITIDKVDASIRFDTLTGVLTRAYLLGRITQHLPEGGAFLMVDADHFKRINDTYGHDVGDEALKRIAEVLRSSLPNEALVGRLGGEEFGVFLPGADIVTAADFATALCAAMRNRGTVIAGRPLNLTISVGGAATPPRESVDVLMKRADVALYQAKHSGRDRHYMADAGDTMPALALKSAERVRQVG